MSDELRVLDGGVGAPNAVLKTLTVTGFKSFVHRTRLEFAPGVTAIIGPNGSGKSNFADAVRWALGESNARALRAKRNEELIFAGSDTRKSLGMAEAVVQLDNSSRRLPIDFQEIEVGRRLFRSGEAEYLVNRSRVRLRDLQDLLAGANLADNPFVVIGQGLVDQVLALRPADRRVVLEEAAGTRRLHLRREEALQRLKSAEVELTRVIDILREIGPRVELLAEQATKWGEYESVRNELRRRALRWYRSSFGTTATARADLAARLDGVDREIARLVDYAAETAEATAATDEELRAAREEEERRRSAATDAAAAESSLRERIAGLQASLEAIAAEHDRSRAVLVALPGELASLRQRRTAIDEEATTAARRARESAEAARRAEEDASRTRLALAEAQAKRVETERAHLLREGEEIRLGHEDRSLLARDEELGASAIVLSTERVEREGERARLLGELGHARDAVAEAARAAEAVASRAGASRSELQRLDGDLALARGQTAALREATERVEAELAAREQGAQPPALPRGLQWLHERLAVPPRLQAAVRAALGDAVAIATSRDAALPHESAQALTVLVPSALADVAPPDGCVRLADQLRLDSDVRAVAGALLRNVFLARDEAAALGAALTLKAGLVVTTGGVLVLPGLVRLPGGNAEAEALDRLRRMAARLREELVGSERSLRETTVERASAERRLAEADARLADAQRERGQRERVADELASAEADVRDTVRAGDAHAHGVERERSEVLSRRERVAADRAASQEARAVAAKAFADAGHEEAAALDSHAAVSKRAEDARLDAATSEERRASLVRLRDTLDEQVGATERRVAEEETRLQALAAQERDGRATLERAQSDLGRAAAASREAGRSAELARERALAAEGSRRESEHRLARTRERLAELRGERAKLAVEEERAAGALKLLEEQVRAELGLPDDEPLPDPATMTEPSEDPASTVRIERDEKDRANALRDLQRLRRRLIALEPVNPLAAAELAEVGERHRFLSTQRDDLQKAIADLRALGDELALTIAEQFSATFQAVDREFGLFFQRLFNGGQASLRASEAGAAGSASDEEPGIDILARPPGKRIGSLNQLSGGERALTATALLFAILRVKPAPFCVLDEVDAALDERNIGRFTQVLRELTDRTQFVVITHNRGTIEAADTLYGVSMDESGVSKVISLRLADLDERAG